MTQKENIKTLKLTAKTIRLLALAGIAIIAFANTPDKISTDYFPPLLQTLQQELTAIILNLN